jgi:hypothetical protein
MSKIDATPKANEGQENKNCDAEEMVGILGLFKAINAGQRT